MAAVVGTALISAVLVVLVPSPASAAPTFTVDDPLDAPDADTSDGLCATATSSCTLRAAVQQANATGGSSVIGFDAAGEGPSLSVAGSGGSEVGDLNILAGVTIRIVGNRINDSNVTQVKADAMADRHFHVESKARLELESVSLVGGTTSGDGGAILNEGQVLITTGTTPVSNAPISTVVLAGNRADGVGGAVANRSGASLRIENVMSATNSSRVDISNNEASGGGAISNDGGSVELVGSTPSGQSQDVYLDNNEAETSDGGAILNTSGGKVTIGCRAFARFSSADRGGGIANLGGDVTLAGGGADGGSARIGGGIYNHDEATLTVVEPFDSCGNDNSIGRSTASEDGGGLFNRGNVTIKAGSALSISGSGSGRDARNGGAIFNEAGSIAVDGDLFISGTAADEAGGGLAIVAGSVLTGPDGDLQVVKTTSGGDGGGVAVLGGSLVARANVSSNTAGGVGGGLAIVEPGRAEVSDGMVLANTSNAGGGISVRGKSAELKVVNTTISANEARKLGGGGVAVADSSATLRHTTVVANAPNGVTSNTAVGLQRVLMASNKSGNCAGSATSSGDFNVLDDNSCAPTGSDLTDTGSFGDVAAMLDPYQVDSLTQYYGLQPGHPAIDFVTDGGCGNPDHDQVGTDRPLDGDGVDGASCDSGAIEAQQVRSPQEVSGTVWDEISHRPLRGVCVFALPTDDHEDGDGYMAITGEDGTYASEVMNGTYLMAFFMPALPATNTKQCGDSGFDPNYQPEWYRNVAVVFKDDSDGADVVLPDPGEVTLVQVDGEDVSGIDACLGAGPGAGLDAPCSTTVTEPGGAAPPGEPASPVTPRAGESGDVAGSGRWAFHLRSTARSARVHRFGSGPDVARSRPVGPGRRVRRVRPASASSGCRFRGVDAPSIVSDRFACEV